MFVQFSTTFRFYLLNRGNFGVTSRAKNGSFVHNSGTKGVRTLKPCSTPHNVMILHSLVSSLSSLGPSDSIYQKGAILGLRVGLKRGFSSITPKLKGLRL